MKTIALCASLLVPPLALAAPVSAAENPSRAVLEQTVVLPVVKDGKKSGSITVPAGLTVAVVTVAPTRILVDFAGADAWIPRSQTDFDERLASLTETNRAAAGRLRQVQQQIQDISRTEQARAADDWQGRLDGWVSPLERGPYDQNRSVVDYYDCWGNRYNIGVFGQRIYN